MGSCSNSYRVLIRGCRKEPLLRAHSKGPCNYSKRFRVPDLKLPLVATLSTYTFRCNKHTALGQEASALYFILTTIHRYTHGAYGLHADLPGPLPPKNSIVLDWAFHTCAVSCLNTMWAV